MECPFTKTRTEAKSLHFDLCSSEYMSVRTPEEQKYQFIFSCTDFTASSDSDKVLSAGDIGYNLFMLNTTISEDLSNKSAKSTHPRHFPFFPLLLSLVIIFSEWKLGLRKCYAFQTVQRGWLHGYPLAVHLICFPLLCLKSRCEDNIRGLLRTLFWYYSLDGPPFVSRDNFLSCAQQNFTKISGNYDKIYGTLLAPVEHIYICNIKNKHFTLISRWSLRNMQRKESEGYSGMTAGCMRQMTVGKTRSSMKQTT